MRGATSQRSVEMLCGTSFQSTLPREGSDARLNVHYVINQCISIHTPREGSDRGVNLIHNCHEISIHTPREGSDATTAINFFQIFLISIHTPREGSDLARAGSHQRF